VDIDTLWLRESGGQAAFFPNNINSQFNFSSEVGLFLTSLIVEGRSTATAPPVTRALSVSGTQHSSGQHSGASSGPIAPLGGKKSSSGQHTNVKIIQAILKRNLNGHNEFSPLSQCHIYVDESTANVTYLNHAIREKWGKAYVLVSVNGLKLEDSSGTQGTLY
jgi:hypothetical protein